MTEKECTICKTTQLISEFRRDKSRKDGYHPHCKTCQLQYRRKDPNNLVRSEGEKRRHKEYEQRKKGNYQSDFLTPSEKASLHLKKYYTENPEVLEKKREQFLVDGEFVLNPYSLKHQNSKGEKFRSSLEVKFSELLIKHNIEYRYEVVFPLINGRRKVVDFLIEDFLIIEVSGYAYKKWQDDFDKKIKLLKQSTDLQILILTYGGKLEEISNNLWIGSDIHFDDIENEEHIIRGINFYRDIYKSNIYLKQQELCGE